MTVPTELTSTQPYLIRAIHEWCCDNRLTPYLRVAVNPSVQVPREYVKDGEIILNIGFDATTALNLGNDYIEFKARFSGAVREIMVPLSQVTAIFARENGQGMAFAPSQAAPAMPSDVAAPEPVKSPHLASVQAERDGTDATPATPPSSTRRATLKRIK